MWIARDEYGDLWLYEEKPFKNNYGWHSIGDCQLLINSDWFPEVRVDDTEPRELVLKSIKEEQQ